MTEVPEHLLERSRERRRALGLPVPGEEGGAPVEAAAPETPAAPAVVDSPVETAAAAEVPDAPAPAISEPVAATVAAPAAPPVDTKGVPAHLLERSAARRAALTGESAPAPAATAAPGATGSAAPSAAATATATAPRPPSTATGPEGHTQRLLTVVKSGSIQQTKADPVDKVHVWPHLLVAEFTAIMALTALLVIFSALVRAPLLELADPNQTPNPSKAPWYFLGLQELLTMFHPMVAGVLIPGIAQTFLMLAPFIDKNPSTNPNDRKFAISLFTVVLMFFAVLVIIGSFFRGPGFNFVYPWNDGIFFDL